VKADDNSFTSGTPSTDPWSFDFQFNTAGTYTYICEAHAGSGMTGTIIVVEPAAFLPIVTQPD
jgi:plastocyanin